MATYSGFLTVDGLPELVDEGQEIAAAQTLHRAVHVNLRHEDGREVVFDEPPDDPIPGDSYENPSWVRQLDGNELHVKVDDGSIRPDLSKFPGGKLPVDTGPISVSGGVTVLNPPVIPPVVFPEPPGSSYDNPSIVEQIDGDKMHVKVDGGSIRPDLGAFPSGKLPVDVGTVPVTGGVTVLNPPTLTIPPFPEQVEIIGEALVWYQAMAERLDQISQRLAPTGSRLQPLTWSFVAAQTNVVIVPGIPGVSWGVRMAKATVDSDTAANVACRIGFSSTGSLPTLSNNSATAITSDIISEPDLAAGTGIVLGNGADDFATSQPGDSILITCEAATSGSIRPTLHLRQIIG